jgi:hypothetical protein
MTLPGREDDAEIGPPFARFATVTGSSPDGATAQPSTSLQVARSR